MEEDQDQYDRNLLLSLPSLVIYVGLMVDVFGIPET